MYLKSKKQKTLPPFFQLTMTDKEAKHGIVCPQNRNYCGMLTAPSNWVKIMARDNNNKEEKMFWWKKEKKTILLWEPFANLLLAPGVPLMFQLRLENSLFY